MYADLDSHYRPAPGSYFFWALAAVAVMASNAAGPGSEWPGVQARVNTGIVSSLLLFSQAPLDQVSQAAAALASTGLFRYAKRHC